MSRDLICQRTAVFSNRVTCVSFSENYYKLIGTGCPKKTEEHSDLNKILQEMAT